MYRSLAILSIGLEACVSFRSVEHKETIAVTAEPDDAIIWQDDETGRHALGEGSATIEKKYTESVASFSHACWIWPGIGAAASLIGLLWLTGSFGKTTDTSGVMDGGPLVGGILTITMGGTTLLTTLPLCLAGLASDGDVQPTGGSRISVSASRPGYVSDVVIVPVPGDVKDVHLKLLPEPLKPSDAVAAAPAAPAHNKQKRVLAVFDIQDLEGQIEKSTLDQLTEYLATQLTETKRYRVIPRDQLRKQLAAEKARSYKECFDVSCQIELGKAVAAEKSVVTKLLRVGSRCALTAQIYDLKTETTEKASSFDMECKSDQLLVGVAAIAKELAQ
jgi:hypothetical protein